MRPTSWTRWTSSGCGPRSPQRSATSSTGSSGSAPGLPGGDVRAPGGDEPRPDGGGDEVRALARGGKRLRPSFAYWGWRGAAADAPGPAEDDAAVLRAVAALEFVHVSALVHDDVMDGASTRRGRPATHLGFAALPGADA